LDFRRITFIYSLFGYYAITWKKKAFEKTGKLSKNNKVSYRADVKKVKALDMTEKLNNKTY